MEESEQIAVAEEVVEGPTEGGLRRLYIFHNHHYFPHIHFKPPYASLSRIYWEVGFFRDFFALWQIACEVSVESFTISLFLFLFLYLFSPCVCVTQVGRFLVVWLMDLSLSLSRFCQIGWERLEMDLYSDVLDDDDVHFNGIYYSKLIVNNNFR